MDRQEAEQVVREVIEGWVRSPAPGAAIAARAALNVLVFPVPLHPAIVEVLGAVRLMAPEARSAYLNATYEDWESAGRPGLPAPETPTKTGAPAEKPWGSQPGDATNPNYGRHCARCLAPVRAGERYEHGECASPATGAPPEAAPAPRREPTTKGRCACGRVHETVATRHRIVVLADGETWEQIAPPTWDAAVYVVDLNNEEFERIHKGNESVQDVVNLKERGKRVI